MTMRGGGASRSHGSAVARAGAAGTDAAVTASGGVVVSGSKASAAAGTQSATSRASAANRNRVSVVDFTVCSLVVVASAGRDRDLR
jgi:hypothetical protein